jgi:DNA polymerase III alpha subunit
MKTDIYGRQILTEDDICELFLQDPERSFDSLPVTDLINFDQSLELENVPNLHILEKLDLSVDDYDYYNQRNWYMPDEYKQFDVAKYVLDMCKTDEELQRVGDELLKFQSLGMLPMLRYCKYLVDVMRNNNIVWGVGRGSSVASYVLYLLGVHRINSLHYDLSIDEFLK